MAATVVNIVLTRDEGRNESLLAWLPPEADVAEVPLTTTAYFDVGDVRAELVGLVSNGSFHSLVVTSVRSVEYAGCALAASALDVDVYCVGPTTASALVARGYSVRALGEGSAVSLAPSITRGPVLMLGARSMRDELASALRAKGLEVVSVSCYETVPLTLEASDVEALRRADVVLIGAPSAWAVAKSHVGGDTWVIVPGTSTGDVVRIEHSRVIEGWGPQLRAQLEALAP
jgi:uroporphyrinogen-III synthase